MSKNVQCFAIIVLIICVAVSAAAGAKKNVTEHCSVYIGKTRTELGIHFDDSKIWSFEEAGSCYKGQGRLSVWYCWRHEWN